jgi:hypothetical protein
MTDAAPSDGPRCGRQAAPDEPGPDAATPGSMVPVWHEGLAVTVLAPDYQRIIALLVDRASTDGEAMNCRQIADALGWETSPARVEGVRSKARRLAERGWLVKEADGRFSSSARRGGGS